MKRILLLISITLSSLLIIPAIVSATSTTQPDINDAVCEAIYINGTGVPNGGTYPTPIKPGEKFHAEIRMKNTRVSGDSTGLAVWTTNQSYKLGSTSTNSIANDNMSFGQNRVELPSNNLTVNPGSDSVFAFDPVLSTVFAPGGGHTEFGWQMLRERTLNADGSVKDPGGRFGQLCSVEINIAAAESTLPAIKPTAGQCPNVQISDPTPTGNQTVNSVNGDVILGWDAVPNATYNLRVADLSGQSSSTAVDNNGNNNCKNNPGYDICVDNITAPTPSGKVPNNSVAISIAPGHSYKWWVDVVPNNTSCTPTTDANRVVNTFKVNATGAAISLTAQTMCTDHDKNLENVTVNWSKIDKAKSYKMFITNSVNTDGSPHNFDFSDRSSCLSGDTTSYSTAQPMPVPNGSVYKASLFAYSDNDCLNVLSTGTQNPSYDLFPIRNAGFSTPVGQQDQSGQYPWELQGLVFGINWTTPTTSIPIDLNTCAPTNFTIGSTSLPFPTGKTKDTPFDMPISVKIYKSQKTSSGQNNTVPSTQKTIIIRYTPIINNGDNGETVLYPPSPTASAQPTGGDSYSGEGGVNQ